MPATTAAPAAAAATMTTTTTTTAKKRGSLKNGITTSKPVVKPILKKQSTTGKLTHNKRITFHNKKKTKRIPNLNSMSEDILADIWWSADDYDDIMRSFEYTVFMMEAGEASTVDDGDEHCTRGLELRTEAGKWARFEHKRDCYNAVLDEQDRQWNDAEEDNQEKIANCCREVTAKTQRIACRKGMQDEKEIQAFVADTRSQISKLQGGTPTTTGRARSKVVNGTHSSSSHSGKQLPARTKSNSTGQLRRRTPRTDSGNKARVEKSPPRKPERVLSGKSERGGPEPAAVTQGAPRTPKRSVSSKSSASSTTSTTKLTPTNSSLQRMPQRQTFVGNNSNNNHSPATPNKTSPSANSPASKPKAVTRQASGANKKKSPSLPKIPKRSASNTSTQSNSNNDSGSVASTGSGTTTTTSGGKLNLKASAFF